METLYRRSTSSVTVTRIFTVLVLASLLFSVLPALAPPGAVAQNGDATTPTAEVQESAEPTPTPPAQEAAETPPPEPTSSAESQPETQGGGVSSFIAEARTCPPGFDPSAGDASAALASCIEPLAGIAITLGTQNPSYPGDTRTTGGDGVAAWPDIPLGTGYTVAQAIPQGYADPWVYCEVTGGPGADRYLFFQATGGFLDIGLSDPDLASYAQSYCRWFALPPADTALVLPSTGVGEIHLTNYLCPDNYDTANMTLAALESGCQEPGEGVQFTLQASQGAARTAATNPRGALDWTDVPSGEFTISESIPDGYRYAQPYCSVAPIGSPVGAPDSSLVQSDGKTITGQLATGQALSCELFTIAEPQSTVAIFPYLCPSDYDTGDMTQGALVAGCTTPGTNIDYTLTSVASEQFPGTTGSNGFIEWKNLPSGLVTIEESVPAGYLLGAVYCDPAPPQGEPDAAPYQTTNVEGDVVTYDIPDRHTLNCFFFHIEGSESTEQRDDASVTISIEKHLCGPELPTSVLVDDWRQACPDPHPGVTFEAWQSSAITSSGVTDAGGLVTLRVLPEDVDILEAQPDEFPGGFAWCGTVVAGAEPTYVNGGRLSPGEPGMPLREVTAGNAYSCVWFNAPYDSPATADDGADITIVKWRCPAGYDTADVPLDELRQTCSTPQPGVQIGVSYASGESFTELTRIEKGPAVARFEGLPPGKVGIGELGPSGHELQRVICTSGDLGPEMFGVVTGYMEYPVAGGGIAATIEASTYLACEFFNVPLDDYEGDPPTAGTVIVDKRICPPGFAAITPDSISIAMYCSSEPGVEFTLTHGDTTLDAVTGIEGLAKFEKIAAGALRIAEFPREGYDQPRVFCRATKVGEGATGELLPASVDNWGIAYDLPEGVYLECVWANMPAPSTSTDPGTVILHAYTCPEGTGDYTPLNELLANCAIRPEGVTFTAGQPLGTPAEVATSPSGDVTFTNVAPGFEAIDQPAGQGYDTVAAWCNYHEGGSASDLARYSAPPLAAYMPGGYTLECSWFQTPYIEPATLDITMRVCPADFPLVDVTNDKILAGCPVIPSGVEVRVQHGSALAAESAPETYDVTLQTDLDGKVSFEEIPPIPLRISESMLNVQTVHANCGSAAIGESPASYTSLTITGDGVDYPAEPNTDITCYWAMRQLPPVDVRINVSSCLPYYEFEAADLDYLSVNCTPEEAVDIRIATEDGGYEKTVATSALGLAVFEQAPPGALAMTEASPDLRVVRVFCGTQSSGETSLAFSGDTATYIADTGEDVTCHWFTIETKWSRITIFTYGCPEDYVPGGQTHDEMLQACPAPLEGVRFDFVHASGSNYDITDDEGVAGFNDVSPGPWAITETPPAKYPSATVFCRENTPGQPKPDFAQAPVQNAAIDGTVDGGNQLECHWFNTRATHARAAVHKFACPEGHTPRGHTYEEVLVECPTPLEGVTFTLGGPAVELSRDTDSSGTVVWEDLAPGRLFISETPPDGHSAAVVFCAILSGGGPEAAFAQVPIEQLSIEYDVAAGETLACFWFDYASHSDPDQPSPTVTPSPGTVDPIVQPGAPTPAPDAPASLIITKHTCEAGYDLHDPGADPAKDCEKVTTGIQFTLNPLGGDNIPTSPEAASATDDDGVVTFSALDAGAWLLAESLSENTHATFISICESDRRDFQQDNPFTPFAYAGPAGEIGVTLLPGETLACDSYAIPEGGVTLLAYQCPGAQAGIAACEPSMAAIDLSFVPVDDGAPITLAAGAAPAHFPAGIYSMPNPPVESCLIDSEAFDTEGNLTVEQDKAIEIRIYTCAQAS